MLTHTIHLLPDALANQIAAGEVVQRPASVVKELLENAVDAGSTTIKLIIKNAGKALIQVIDNGIGMSDVDARMSLEKHATSKINHADDLFNIGTLGFRGEALPSIAAVSQLTIETKAPETELGCRLIVEASTVKSQLPAAVPQGTTLTVKNLFFNVPARRNFLKSDAIETRHIIEEFQHIALARPDIAFSLYQNDQETYRLPAAKLAQRIIHLFGESYKKHLIHCQESTAIVQIQGYIGTPHHIKKTRGEQFFFVNKRFIKSNSLHHAIKMAFDPFIQKDMFPFYVLFIDIAPQHIDVNVHPTKVEIKFDDEKMVYAILRAAVQQALATHTTPSLDFEYPIKQDPLGLTQLSPSSLPQGMSPNDRRYAQFKAWNQPAIEQQEWESLLKKITIDRPPNSSPMLPGINEEKIATSSEGKLDHDAIPSSRNILSDLREGTVEKNTKIQLQTTYILTPVKSGLLLVDQQAAQERILYEKYVQHLKNQGGTSQHLLFPEQIELNQADFELLATHALPLAALGFSIEIFGSKSILLVGYPAEAAQGNPKQLLEAVLEQIKWNQTHLSLPIQENIARSMAHHAALQNKKRLLPIEMDHLVDQLFACTNPNHAPDGRKIWVTLSLETLAKLLKN